MVLPVLQADDYRSNMSEKVIKVRTPGLPLYSIVRELLHILPGVPKPALTDMLTAIAEQRGTPQRPVDWADPDRWIAERLAGAAAALAARIWRESRGAVNPRWLRNPYAFMTGHRLLEPDSRGIYHLTERGRAFLDDDPVVVREIDDLDGVPQLLYILATKTRARRADLLPEWRDLLRVASNFDSESTITGTLRHRLVNVIERGFARREGQTSYVITEAGVAYAAPPGPVDRRGDPKREDPKRDVLQAITTYNARQRQALKERLDQMDPYRFEHLIANLLDAMGYDDVQVTQASGDKGVDVVGTVRFGFTTIREYVQVKRQQGGIQRPTVDQLRGALPYHQALRGTIITTGTFSSGCHEAAAFQGAAPISLVNGEQLLDLLLEHKLGVIERPATLYELDEAVFSDPVESDASDERVNEPGDP